MLFTDELFKFVRLLFTIYSAIPNTYAPAVGCHHNVFLARSLRAGSSNLQFRHH